MLHVARVGLHDQSNGLGLAGGQTTKVWPIGMKPSTDGREENVGEVENGGRSDLKLISVRLKEGLQKAVGLPQGEVRVRKEQPYVHPAQEQLILQLLKLNSAALWHGPLRPAPCHLQPNTR